MIISDKRWGETWKESYPFGNGHLGAMVTFNPYREEINLSHNTFYSGEPGVFGNQVEASGSFALMREKVRSGEYYQAEEIQKRFIGRRENYGTNLPVGKVILERSGAEVNSVESYKRTLEMETGMGSALTELKGEEGDYEAECFASHPRNAFFYKGQMHGRRADFSIQFFPEVQAGEIQYLKQGILFHTRALETMHSDGRTGVRLAGGVRVWTDGVCVWNSHKWEIRDAGWVILRISMETDYKKSGLDFMELCSKVKRGITGREIPDYQGWKEEHIKDFSHYMRQSSLEVETTDNYGDEIARLYQYGRYLLLASSREDSMLPAHLQGVWNDNVASRIGWTCDMHLDINTQMNYWPAEVTGLSDCVRPLFRWVEEDLVRSGEITAKESYGRAGWAAELVSNAWAYTAPYWDRPISPCPTGGLWVATHLWEHYQFTRDREFLEKQVFPVISKAVDFFTEYVFWDNTTGMYLTGPSISPENSFIGEDNKVHYLEIGCTYEVLLIRELYTVFLKICDILGIEDDRVRLVAEQREKLPPYPMNADGTLGEWMQNHKEADIQHRHTSHLLGLYPFCQITPKETPELAAAAQKSIERKITPEKNWEDTGWARALLLLYSTRLQDGEQAYRHMRTMIDKLKAPNHMIIHPPTRGASAFADVYELDGNTGLTAGIAEMLIQSHGDTIRIMPACPSCWIKGRAFGLKVRGGLTADIKWENGNVEVEFRAEHDFVGYLEKNKEIESIFIGSGQKKVYKFMI
ncbi:MAG: glycoside hydrolase N-terminal domain-containing protein [Eubacteriales bacterium]|nr:glycoside hydrolase N-terminal domain-containing protein [Eubacteriales bacterium]